MTHDRQYKYGLGSVIRYEDNERDFVPAFGDDATIAAISDHIEQYVGKIATVHHEILSHLVHLDVHFVLATPERPWHTLVTSGMSDLPMNPPADCSDQKFAELMISLPGNWPLDNESLKDPIWFWPIAFIKLLARLPHEYGSWLWHGHTVPNGDPPEPFGSNTTLCGGMLVYSPTVPDEFLNLAIGDKNVEIFAVLPLYEQEMNYKIKNGSDLLLQRLADAQISDIVDLTRRNVSRRRFLGLF